VLLGGDGDDLLGGDPLDDLLFGRRGDLLLSGLISDPPPARLHW
jgi:hypothetical protein